MTVSKNQIEAHGLTPDEYTKKLKNIWVEIQIY